MTAPMVMAVDARNRETLSPNNRTIATDGFGRDRRQDMTSNSDIRDDRGAAMDAARQQQVSGLAAEECDGARGDYRGTASCPLEPSMPEEISPERIGFFVRFVHSLRRKTKALAGPSRSRARPAPKSASTTRPAESRSSLLDGEDLAGPKFGGKRGVAPQAVARTKQSELDGKVLRGEHARGDGAARRHYCRVRSKPRHGHGAGEAVWPPLPPPRRPVPSARSRRAPRRWSSRSASAISELVSNAAKGSLTWGILKIHRD